MDRWREVKKRSVKEHEGEGKGKGKRGFKKD